MADYIIAKLVKLMSMKYLNGIKWKGSRVLILYCLDFFGKNRVSNNKYIFYY